MSRKWEQIISDIKVQPILMLLVILPADRETQGIYLIKK